ncbi:MAG: ABC transporter ATP-binding protein [Christensenellales bacterium]
MEQAILTNQLTKRYGRARGIQALDLSVSTGDIFGFIGPNGAGKSTLIRTLLGLIRPSGGSARILGQPLAHKREILRRVGYMPSEAAYYPRMRVKEVFKMSAQLRRKDCERESWVLCDRLSLDPNRLVQDLSYGNKKKVAIVTALQHRPELLILDEPTGGLDPLMQRAFWDLITERNAQGTTVFLSSHVLSEVQHHCRHAAIIREGSLVVSDTVENLAQNAAKRVTLRGLQDLPPALLMLAGVRDPQRHEGEVTFLFSGDVHELMPALAGLSFTDLSIAEPELEEIFMHFYEQGAGRL